MDVGRTLRHARRRARLTQRALAEAAGVPQSTVARIESGTHVPRVDTFERLLETCGMDIELTHKGGDGIDLTMIDGMLELTPEERIRGGIRMIQRLPRQGVLLERRP
jgi:transcriptional regulator with XRE-family HTH domain